MHRYGFALALGLILVPTIKTSLAADLHLSVVEAGTRDYYCTVELMLKNGSALEVQQLNGRVLLLGGSELLGESQAGSLLQSAPDSSVSTVFSTPNAPCDEIDAYRFEVGICRIDGNFVSAEECADQLSFDPPIAGIEAR